MNTRATLTKLIEAHGATPVFEESFTSCGNKQHVSFVCKCRVSASKAVRDIIRCGAMCKACQANNKRETISLLKTLPKAVITDPETQKICATCKRTKDKAEFTHAQNAEIEINNCVKCREKHQAKDTRLREKRKLTEVDNADTHQKCIKCLKIFEKDKFKPDVGSCAVCRKGSDAQNKKWKSKAKLINDEDSCTKMCIRCKQTGDKNKFITESGHLGVVCISCRDMIGVSQDTYKEHYVAYKKSRGPCVDCGESDMRLLDFDHIDRDGKVMTVSSCKSLEQLMAEGPKCEMRCIRCHQKRTSSQLNFYGVSKTRRGVTFARKISQDYVNNKKVEIGACCDCGWFDATLLEALHFDHIDPTRKRYNISEMAARGMSKEDIDMEMAECELRCSHCHRIRTFVQFNCKLYEN